MAFPGFDTGSYPGDHVMDEWFGNPYVFTGYYLEAPCHNANTFRPWQGHMATLKQIGWGFVVVYVGRQAVGCGSGMLSRAQGLADAIDAISKARTDAMPNDTTIFLDIEVMDHVSAAMVDYMRGWIAGILQDRTYKPGIYSHFRNAVDLRNAAQQEFADQGLPGGAPAFWVVRVPGGAAFNVNTSSPEDLADFATHPITFADVWQGKINIPSETHNGVQFGPVDQNVAKTANPSGA
jgi:glycoside hydrolase-like protein